MPFLHINSRFCNRSSHKRRTPSWISAYSFSNYLKYTVILSTFPSRTASANSPLILSSVATTFPSISTLSTTAASAPYVSFPVLFTYVTSHVDNNLNVAFPSSNNQKQSSE